MCWRNNPDSEDDNANQDQILPIGHPANDKCAEIVTKRPSKKMCVTHSNVNLHIEPIVKDDPEPKIEIIHANAIEKTNGHFV